jgi:hypothetical protein
MVEASRAAQISRRKRVDFVRRLTYQPYEGRRTGTCAIDLLANEYFEKNIFSVRCEISEVRNAADQAFSDALYTTKAMLIHWPAEHYKVRRFLHDLSLMDKLLDRNKELFVHGEPGGVWKYLTRKHTVDLPSFEQWKNRLQNLLATLNKAHADARFVLDTSEIHWEAIEFAPPSRNFDPLTFFFIEHEFFDVWCQFRPLESDRAPPMPRRDVRPFARFLAAVWRDLNLPLEDYRGRTREPLEAWFADRIRKHFENWI